MNSDKQEFTEKLSVALQGERGLLSLKYETDYKYENLAVNYTRVIDEAIIITYDNNYTRVVDVTCNSNLAIAEAVVKELLK